jgi:hypothetical protein
VEYFALQLLLSIADEDRARALAIPFKNSPQYHMAVALLQEEQAGAMKTQDVGAELLSRCPNPAAVIPYNATMRKAELG